MRYSMPSILLASPASSPVSWPPRSPRPWGSRADEHRVGLPPALAPGVCSRLESRDRPAGAFRLPGPAAPTLGRTDGRARDDRGGRGDHVPGGADRAARRQRAAGGDRPQDAVEGQPRRHDHAGGRLRRRAQRRRLRAGRAGVDLQQRRLRLAGAQRPLPARAAAGRLRRRLHPGRRPRHAARSRSSTPTAGSTSSRAPTTSSSTTPAASGSPTRARPGPATATSARSTTPRPTVRRSARSASAWRPPTASASPPTAPPSTWP